MYTFTFNIYKPNHFKWQEQILLNVSTKDETKPNALKLPISTYWSMDLTVKPDLHTINPYLNPLISGKLNSIVLSKIAQKKLSENGVLVQKDFLFSAWRM